VQKRSIEPGEGTVVKISSEREEERAKVSIFSGISHGVAKGTGERAEIGC